MVVRELEPLDPGAAFARLAGRPGRVALESLEAGPGTGRWSIVAADPLATIRFENERVVLAHGAEREVFEGDPFVALRAALAACGGDRAASAEAVPPVPFAGGAIGFLSYELARRRWPGKLPGARADVDPPMHFGIYGAALLVERATGRTFVAARGTAWESAEAAAGRTATAVSASVATDVSDSVSTANSVFGTETAPQAKTKTASQTKTKSETAPQTETETETSVAFRSGVSSIRTLISSGDVYQVNLSARFAATTPLTLAALWSRLRATSPEPFAACLDAGDRGVLCASMERLLEVRGRAVESRPIKGTIARGATPAEDAAARERLLLSEKDRAELLMIVDLHRNDLGRVCVPGTVSVPALFEARTFAHVHHLEATVRGTLRADADAIDALAAVFPAGSITGAPKLRAMQVIEELETTPRGVYCGALGYLGFDGAADFAVAIRTAVLEGTTLRYSAGGGIVWDSDPAAEWDEVVAKSRGFRALASDREG